MIAIYTKQINGTYYCYSTINGYDYSFEGVTVESAQRKMFEHLIKTKMIYITTWAWAIPGVTKLEEVKSAVDGE